MLAGWPGVTALAQDGAAEVTQFRVEREDDGLLLSALVRLELTPVIEDALQKGVPMFFVAEAEIFRSRWYWYDQKVTSASKSFRLAFQTLTRRWRLSAASVGHGEGNSSAALNQHFESLPEAMATLRRITRWRVAESNEIPAGAGLYVNFRFRLDVSQLPRPFQIGAVGQADWNIGASISQPLSLGSP